MPWNKYANSASERPSRQDKTRSSAGHGAHEREDYSSIVPKGRLKTNRQWMKNKPENSSLRDGLVTRASNSLDQGYKEPERPSSSGKTKHPDHIEHNIQIRMLALSPGRDSELIDGA